MCECVLVSVMVLKPTLRSCPCIRLLKPVCECMCILNARVCAHLIQYEFQNVVFSV